MKKISNWAGMTESHGFVVDVFEDTDAQEFVAYLGSFTPALVPQLVPGTEIPIQQHDEQEVFRAESIDALQKLVKHRIVERCGEIRQFEQR